MFYPGIRLGYKSQKIAIQKEFQVTFSCSGSSSFKAKSDCQPKPPVEKEEKIEEKPEAPITLVNN